ncbi:AMP-binding protein [Nocardioides sambongensis]|uniref:AMP-binding protein n=1 Tax=Nocardioides sambongensis TaxID=2589074 RepID=UPI001E47A37C|nr:AMP-binding protein [Nocardioides sambongensis]
MDYFSPAGSPVEVERQLAAWLTGDAPARTRLVVATSGSTGRPKQVVLSRDAVLASVRASAAALGASGPWVLALPAGYVAGVQVIARSLVAGHPPTRYDESGWPDGSGWFTSLVPTQLVRMLRSADDTAALARAHTVLLGGGPIDPGLRARAGAAGIRVVATYGAAETAGGCVYDGLPLDGVGLALDPTARIRISGPTLFDGYRDDPERTAETLVDGWYLTSDAGRIDEDGRLQVLGRIDDMVVSGGVNVPAAAVARRLRAHPALGSDRAEVEVLGVPDAEWGMRAVAFIAPHPRSDAPQPVPPLEELRDWVAAAHPRSWAVRQVVVLDALPLLGNGKPDRQALRVLAEEAR